MAGIDINLVIVGAFLLLTLVVGLWAGRNVKTLKDYALANREFGVGVLTMTFLATYIGGNNLIQLPGFFSVYGIVQFLTGIGEIVAFIVFGLWVAPSLIYFRDSITIGRVADTLFGPSARIVVGISGVIYGLCLMIMQILVIGQISEVLLNILVNQYVYIILNLLMAMSTRVK
jgi:SSS family solute:Na+ symporter